MKNRQSKIRLDNLILQRGLATSRHKAQALIMAGKVLVDGLKIEKPGKEVSLEADLSILEDLPLCEPRRYQAVRGPGSF